MLSIKDSKVVNVNTDFFSFRYTNNCVVRYVEFLLCEIVYEIHIYESLGHLGYLLTLSLITSNTRRNSKGGAQGRNLI